MFEGCNNPIRNCQGIKENAARESDRCQSGPPRCDRDKRCSHNNAQKVRQMKGSCCNWQMNTSGRRISSPVVALCIYFGTEPDLSASPLAAIVLWKVSLNVAPWIPSARQRHRDLFLPPPQPRPSSSHRQASFCPNHKLLKDAFSPIRKDKIKARYSTSAIRSVFPWS